jgi:Arc/MetJ-type ribon-helix-helix transcriptional regulator
MTNKKLVALNIRVPETLKQLIADYVDGNCHTNTSEFVRDALREKLAKDCPELYKQVFEKKTEGR